jgi:ABC-2 type transport system permease protein
MKVYLFAIKLRIQKALAYRFDLISVICVQCIVMFAISYFWIAAYGRVDSVHVISKKSMLTYTTISILMGNLLSMNVQNRIIDNIRTGNVALDMLKPVNMYGFYFAEDIGELVISLFQKVLPLFIISSFMFEVPIPKSFSNFILFLVSFVFAYLINWLLAALLGLWAIQIISMEPLEAVKSYIIKLLSGSIIPLWFFPKSIQAVLEMLPFVSIYQVPLGIYIGKYTVQEAGIRMGLQLFWVLVLFAMFQIIQRKMSVRVFIQGG